MKKLIAATMLFFATLSVNNAFGFTCKTTQSGTPTKELNYCLKVDSRGIGTDGSNVYGHTSAIEQQLRKYEDGKTTICVAACAVESDLEVYKINSTK